MIYLHKYLNCTTEKRRKNILLQGKNHLQKLCIYRFSAVCNSLKLAVHQLVFNLHSLQIHDFTGVKKRGYMWVTVPTAEELKLRFVPCEAKIKNCPSFSVHPVVYPVNKMFLSFKDYLLHSSTWTVITAELSRPSLYFLFRFLPNLSNLWFCIWFYIWLLLLFLARYQGLLIPKAGILILRAWVSQMYDSQSPI